MDTNSISLFLNDWLGIILDAGLICGFFLLWFSWFRNGKRQQRLEQMLLETSSQLEAATAHLSQATEAIEQLRQQAQRRSSRRNVEHTADDHIGSDLKKSTNTKPSPPLASTLPQQNSTQATMILRMQREGESSQTIAERLDMPLAQVKLLLKLHAAAGSTS